MGGCVFGLTTAGLSAYSGTPSRHAVHANPVGALRSPRLLFRTPPIGLRDHTRRSAASPIIPISGLIHVVHLCYGLSVPFQRLLSTSPRGDAVGVRFRGEQPNSTGETFTRVVSSVADARCRWGCDPPLSPPPEHFDAKRGEEGQAHKQRWESLSCLLPTPSDGDHLQHRFVFGGGADGSVADMKPTGMSAFVRQAALVIGRSDLRDSRKRKTDHDADGQSASGATTFARSD